MSGQLRRCSHATETWQCGRLVRHESGACRAHRDTTRLAAIAAAERRVVEAAEAFECSDSYTATDELLEAVAALRAAREAK